MAPVISGTMGDAGVAAPSWSALHDGAMRLRRLVPLLLLAAACSPSPPEGPDGPDVEPGDPTASAGYALEQVVSGLEGPTQVVEGPDGRLWVAQLAGAENAGEGQVVAVEPESGEIEVLLEGLVKPTGIAVLDEHLWVMEQDSLGRAPLDGDGAVGELEVLLDALPTNGRSEGTLTVTPDDTLLYDTSGALAEGVPIEGSGTLWELDPATPTAPEVVATGFKHAYAHVAGDGRIWTTEMNDGSFDGEPGPEEVVLLDGGGPVDGGWPRCIGDRQPVDEYGGTQDDCAATIPPLAVLDPGATPTGLALAPWDALLTTSWTRGEVLALPTERPAAAPPAPPVTIAAGLEGPQHLLVAPDGDGVLLTEHTTGTVWRLTRT